MTNTLIRLRFWVPVCALFAMMAAGTQSAYGQVSATANATAFIAAPITITKVTDLQFGGYISGIGGTVTISTVGARTSSGPIPLSNTLYPVGVASFTLTGAPNYVYTITLPGPTVLAGAGGSNMNVTTFVSNPSATGTLSAGGTSTLTVGGTLTLSGNQTPGTYTGTFAVTVSYQ